MKRYGIAAVLIIFIPLLAHASVQITEIAWMGTSESSYCEWLELYNDGDTSQSLANWELDEGGGSTKIITLSKTIPSKAYVLVERVTPSCPDPVPSANDEAGSFGGSGLSNSGEDIVLKDDSGTTVQELNYTSGWPAGDATSKDTMQWNGSSWVTAAPTPEAGFSGTSSDDTSDNDDSDDTSGSAPQKLPTFTPHIDLALPQNVYTGVEDEYDATVTIEHGQTTAGYFIWNFGDGTAVRQTGLVPIFHSYRYPGSYEVTFSYYPSTDLYGSPKPTLQAVKTVTVQSAGLTMQNLGGGWFQIKNSLDDPVDVSGWKLVSNGTASAFPEFSFVAANATINISLETFQLPMSDTLALVTPQGQVVATTAAARQAATIQKSSYHPISATPLMSDAAIDTASLPALIANAAETPSTTVQKNRARGITYGAALLTIIVLFLLLERFMAKRE